jgi:hypothetical protein
VINPLVYAEIAVAFERIETLEAARRRHRPRAAHARRSRYQTLLPTLTLICP